MKITLTAGQAATLVKALKAAVSTDPVRVHLTGVKIASVSNGATLTATDGYRMHEISIAGAADHHQIELLVNAGELFDSLAAAVRIIGKDNYPVTLDYDYGNEVLVQVNNAAAGAAGVMNLDFPSCGSLLDNTPDSENGAMFNAGFFADLMKAAESVAATGKGKNRAALVTVETMSTRKPCRVTASNDETGVSFRGLIMPCRK